MKRRSLLWGAGLAAAAAGAALLKPSDEGGSHDTYFAALNDGLRKAGPGHPVMLLDLDRVDHNIAALLASMGEGATAGRRSKTYRIVVKSLPSMPLLKHLMQTADTNALMVFHQPFLSAVARAFPDSDLLLGKPMPINAVNQFYRTASYGRFDPARQIQWLIDTPERLEQYLAFARTSGVKMRVNFELDVGLHRGGFVDAEQSARAIKLVLDNPAQLGFAGFMGYEPHLAGVVDRFEHPALQEVISTYVSHLDRARALGINPDTLTLNGAGSHTLGWYRKDRVLNDLSAGSAIVKPTDFDTPQLASYRNALHIATPVLKHYADLTVPGDRWVARALPLWNPNTAQLYFIYGGYWKARMVSPPGVQDWLYHSTNQSPMMASRSVDLKVDDYMFLRPTQSEHVMLQFGDLRVFRGGEWVDQWPVFQQS